jgi:hypothetical protein
VKSHRLEENRNEQIDAAVTAWSKVADMAQCSVLLVHHFRKGGQSGDQDAFRGASALIDASRAAVSLAPMSEQDAEFVGIDPKEARRFVRVDNAKLNLTPRPEEAHWLELVSVHIDSGDDVQAVRAWQRPGAFGDLSIDDCNAILDEIARAQDTSEPYTAHRTGSARWGGYAAVTVAAERGVQLSDGQAAGVLRAWLTSGCLIESEYRDTARRVRKCIRVVDDKRPGREAF